MANKRGPDFGDVLPRNPETSLLRASGPNLVGSLRLEFEQYGLANGEILQVTPTRAFSPGQQLLIWLTIYNPVLSFFGGGTGYFSQVKIKPWWLRPNLEFRPPGEPPSPPRPGQSASWLPVDQQTFGGRQLRDNRRVWIPSQKIVSVSEFAPGPTPPPALAGHVDSYYVDDVWVIDLQDPTDPDYANIPRPAGAPTQEGLWRSLGFLYVSHGYALGFTCDSTITMIEGPPAPTPRQPIPFDLNIAAGTLG